MEYVNQKLLEFKTFIKNKRIAVIGVGISNLPLLDFLTQNKAKVVVFDKRSVEEIGQSTISKFMTDNIQYHLGKTYLSYLEGFDIIFRSPSCMPNIPEIQAEIEKGAILTSEIEMLLELCPGTIIGVTGSDGKTTTTSLIYEIIKKKGYNCYLGGNIGIPLFTKIDEMVPTDIVVLELSSFQLMTAKVSPQIAVITNITPNHLDIHSSYEEYIDAKKNIFRYQDEEGILVLNYDNDITYKFAPEAKGKVLYFGRENKPDNGFIEDIGLIKLCQDKIRTNVMAIKDLKLPGKHNCENVCAAFCATKTLVDLDTAVETAKKFKGVEHRIEFVKELNGIKWYNDSASSSPSRSIAGINSFDEEVVLIAGGYDKNLDYAPLAPYILKKVKHLILFGQTANKILEVTEKEMIKKNKHINIYSCDNLAETVAVAKRVASKGSVVLFSPASASFGLFKNFAERGERFKNMVNSL